MDPKDKQNGIQLASNLNRVRDLISVKQAEVDRATKDLYNLKRAELVASALKSRWKRRMIVKGLDMSIQGRANEDADLKAIDEMALAIEDKQTPVVDIDTGVAPDFDITEHTNGGSNPGDEP